MASRTEFLIHDLKFRELADKFPVNVFPMAVKLTLSRTEKRDGHMLAPGDEPIREPAYPLDVRLSGESPYINAGSVYIANPIRDFDVSQKIWRFEDFVSRQTAAKEAIANQYPGDDDRLYLNEVRLCEVPEEYAYREDSHGNKLPDDAPGGRRAIDSNLYDDRAEVYIGRFTKRPKITDKDVLEQLAERAPGQVMQPLRLASVKQVYAKNHRSANTCRKFFSESQATQYNDSNLAPREWSADSEAYTQQTLRAQFKRLSESDFYDPVRFDGHYDASERFVPEQATVLERVRGASA